MSPPPAPDLESWAKAYRLARRPSAELRQQVSDVLFEAHAARKPPLTMRQWSGGLAVGALLGAAALLALTCSLDAIRARAIAGTPGTVAPMQVRPGTPDPVEQSPRVSDPPIHAEAETPQASPAPAPRKPSARGPSSGARPLSSSRGSSKATAERTQSADLDSLRLLRAAGRSLRNDPKRALELLEQHMAEFPQTKLWPERESLWIRAACRSGGATGLEARRASFERRTEFGAYRLAIAQDCDEQ